MKKKLIILIKRDQTSDLMAQLFIAFNAFPKENSSLDFEFVLAMHLSDGFKKLKWASLERDCETEDLFCRIKTSSKGLNQNLVY